MRLPQNLLEEYNDCKDHIGRIFILCSTDSGKSWCWRAVTRTSRQPWILQSKKATSDQADTCVRIDQHYWLYSNLNICNRKYKSLTEYPHIPLSRQHTRLQRPGVQKGRTTSPEGPYLNVNASFCYSRKKKII